MLVEFRNMAYLLRCLAVADSRAHNRALPHYLYAEFKSDLKLETYRPNYNATFIYPNYNATFI